MKVFDLRRFLVAALKEQNAWFLLLSFKASANELEDWSLLSESVRWLHDPACDRSTLCEDLRRHGLGIVSCSSAEEVEELCEEANKCRRLWAEVYR